MTRPSRDLIVVGAGSAGAAFAARCAERGRDVLVLEAGRDYRAADLPAEWRSPNPVHAVLSPSATDYIWPDLNASRTDEQPAALYWRGRGVGGSSTVNGQIAIRPPLEDFDLWTGEGIRGWSRDDVLPYFCKLESDLDFGDADYHGSDGPTPIQRVPRSAWGAVDQALSGAALEHGFPWAEDVNAPGATGVSPYPVNSRNSARVSTNDAYLEEARGLGTLEIRGDSLVDAVVLQGATAVGVRLADGTVLRGDEIVLSAGVIGSPTVLMRSGIGRPDVLRPLGIEVRQDLPVGEGMQDHPMRLVALPLKEHCWAGRHDRHTNCCVRYGSGQADLPNDMMLVALNQAVLAASAAETMPGAGALGIWLNHTFSRGSVRIVSADPRVQPAVRENMLADERDRARLREGTRLLAGLLDSPQVREVSAVDPWRVNAEFRGAVNGSDEDLDRDLLRTVTDTQHGTSTCRMGPVDAPHTVVDSSCRVLGIDRLSIVDASVFPSVPRANTNLITIMAGELMAARFLSA